MAAPLIDRPDLTAPGEGGDGLTHTVCCDDTRALCGAAVDVVNRGPGADSAAECVVCVDLDEAGVACGRPFCRLRLWWRRRRDRGGD